jgi:SRSO17 transposase
LCSVVAMLSDGKTAIPIDQELWLSKEIMKEAHKTKVEIALDLIIRVKETVKIKMIIADGLYATERMIEALEQQNIFFEMRFHANRIIEYKEKKVAVRDLEDLKLKDRRTARTKRALWKKMTLYFTSVKRATKTRRVIIVYQVSNFLTPAKKHVQIYGLRWNIEKFFRTSKQHLGLAHCQMRLKSAQENHIFNVFFAYALLQTETKNFGLKNPKTAVRRLKLKNYPTLTTYFSRSVQIFGDTHA